MTKMTKKIIGRIDKVDFPLLNLKDLNVKIDTGAYTSTIHCSKISLEDTVLKCLFFEKGHPYYTGKECEFESFSMKQVKSSNGISENRYRINTSIILFNKTYKINLTLSSRDDMRFPVLIGRRFLSNKFIVDVNLKNESYKNKLSIK
jgi:hypothetical protein